MKELINIIIPCYNEEETVELISAEIEKVMSKSLPDYDYTVLFIDDGSKDKTLEKVKAMAEKDSHIKYLSFSRNFGKEAAMFAGLDNSKGDYVVFMDADLQDPPALLPEMLKAIKEEGYDSVATRRVTRKGEPVIRSFCARMFYKIINKISDADITDGARDYRLMSRKYVDALLKLSENQRFTKGLFGWVGYKTKWLEYENIERVAGETKWNFWKLLRYSLEGIVAFSVVPLEAISIAGLSISFLSFILIIVLAVRQLCFHNSVSGWTSLACIISMFSGMLMLSMGILGQYLSKMYLEIKNRPIYLVGETNLEEEK